VTPQQTSRTRGGRGRRTTRGAVRLLAALALVAVGLVWQAPVEARYATGGVGTFQGDIDWIEWGTADEVISGGRTVTSTRTINGLDLTVTCTLSGQTGGLIAYRPGYFPGDALDNMYNIGGTGTSNQLIAGIANEALPATVSFDVSCTASYDGEAVPLQGLVFGDAESSDGDGGEYIEATPASAATWRLIDRYKSPTCATDSMAAFTGSTLRIFSNGKECWKLGSLTGPDALMFMQGATGGHFTIEGHNRSAIAIGTVFQTDFGDAPASYGVAGAFYQPSWNGGLVAADLDLFTGVSPATQAEPTSRLGALVDAEGSQLTSVGATGDNAAGQVDEDALATTPSSSTAWGGTWTLSSVPCTGPGSVRGWVDWNHNGTFDTGEGSDTAACTGATVDLSWTVPDDAVDASTFLRLRIADPPADLTTPTGMSAAGEVEDYPMTVDVPNAALTLDKTAAPLTDPDGNGPDIGDTIAYSLTVTNTGTADLANLTVTDALAGTVDCPADTLAVGATIVCTATYVLTQADVDTGHVDNTAMASGEAVNGTTAHDTDTATVSFTPTATLTLSKTASGPDVHAADGTIAYTFTVTNTGAATLDTIVIDDPLVAAVDCPATTLAPGATLVCTATHTLTQADVDAGYVDNSATAYGNPPTGDPTDTADDTTDTDTTHTLIDPAPALVLAKTAVAVGDAAGQTIDYELEVTNTGNVTLDTITVDDPLVGTVTCPATPIAPGVSVTCTGSYVLTLADLDSGHVANTATAYGNPPTGDPTDTADDATDTDTIDTPLVPTPALTLVKTAVGVGGTAGETIDYELVVTNTGNVTLDHVTVDDPLVTGLSCPVTTLAPGASTTCTASHTLSQADVDAGYVDNTATASGNPPGGDPADPSDDVTDTDSAHTPIAAAPSVVVDKSGSLPVDPAAGDTVDFTIVVVNTGNVTLGQLFVDDPVTGTVDCPVTTLAPGEDTTCTTSHVLTQSDLDSGHLANTATAYGNPPAGDPADTSDDATASDSVDLPVPPTAALTVAKHAGAPSGSAVGDTIDYTFTVTNTGTVTLDPVQVDDPLTGTVDCPVTTLAPGDETTCTAMSYSLTQADVDAGQVDNTATAYGNPPTGDPADTADDATDTDTTHTSLSPTAAISLVKAAATVGDAAGQTIDYTFEVTNTGDVTLDPITVDDPLTGPVTCPAISLAPGASTTCTATYTLTQDDIDAGHIDNTATATGTPTVGAPVTDQDTVSTPLAANPGLTLAKTAGTPTGDHVGDTIAYTFTITNTGNVTLDPITVDDPLVDTLDCPTTTLAPGGELTCTATYPLTQDDIDAGHVDNTATAWGNPPAGDPTDTADDTSDTDTTHTSLTPAPALSLVKTAAHVGSAAGQTIDYDLLVTNTGNVTLDPVTVDDPLLDTLDCPTTTLAPGAHTTCTGSYPLTQADLDLGHVDNTATASGTPPTGAPVTDQDTISTPLPRSPAISLVKTADTTGPVRAGDTIAYTFTVTNTGNTTLTNLTVTDPKLGPVSCAATTLAPAESTTCTGPDYTVTAQDADRGRITNHAVARGEGSGGTPVDADDQVTTAAGTPHPGIHIDKHADTNGPVHAGQTIAYTFTVTNTGNTTLTHVRVTDPMIGEVSCPRTDLAPGEHMTCTGTRYVVTSNDASQQTLANHATAHATSCPTSDTCSRVTDDDTLSLPTTSNTHLPDTGSTMPPWATPAALATLITGLLLVATGRRHRR